MDAVTRDAYIAAADFCIRIWPPEKRLVALITANFDDSQSTGDVWTVAGYAGYRNQWELFEGLWTAALSKHDVPYFHMNEMADPKGPFAKWLPPEDHQDEVRAFFSDLVSAIRKSNLCLISSGVWLKDLEEFNAASGLALEAYPLAAYACMVQIVDKYAGSPVSAVFDHVEKIDDKLRKAEVYAESDPRGNRCETVAPSKLPMPLTTRDVPAMQAADFIAWEYRKALFNMRVWQRLPDRPNGPRHKQWEHYRQWSREVLGKKTLFRKSFSIVAASDMPAHSLVWAHDQLDFVNRLRSGIWSLEAAARSLS